MPSIPRTTAPLITGPRVPLSSGIYVPVSGQGSNQPPSSNANPVHHLEYWMRVVLSNNSLQAFNQAPSSSCGPTTSSMQNIPPSTSGLSLRAATARPIAPLHSHLPYTMNSSSRSNTAGNNRELISHATSLLDITNAEPLFYVGASGKLLCRCCVNCSGFTIPLNTTVVSRTNPNRRVLTTEWRSFKKSLRYHLGLSSHLADSRDYYQRQGLSPLHSRIDTEAGLNLIRMVYENVKTGRSYASFGTSCATRFLEGTQIGFQNHSAQFPPAIIDCAFEVLQGTMKTYITQQTPFGTFLVSTLWHIFGQRQVKKQESSTHRIEISIIR